MDNTKIEWTGAFGKTHNEWIGCDEVSPGCANCYARELAVRYYKQWGVKWGKDEPRYHTSLGNRNKPHQWNRGAEGVLIDGKPLRPKVFCSSLSDWLDDEIPLAWLADLLQTIDTTPNLDWLLLSKRPENWRRRIRAARDWALAHYFGSKEEGVIPMGIYRAQHATYVDQFEEVAKKTRDECMDVWKQVKDGAAMAAAWTLSDVEPTNDVAPANVVIGTTAENQHWLQKRILHLVSIPARAHFLSVEPMLGAMDVTFIDLGPAVGTRPEGLPREHFTPDCPDVMLHLNALTGVVAGPDEHAPGKVDWIIVGGESGRSARPIHPQWVRDIRDQCKRHGTPFFFKQWGEWGYVENDPGSGKPAMTRLGKKGSGRILDGQTHSEFYNITDPMTETVLKFVEEYMEREQRPPAVREIQEWFGWKSPRAASYHLDTLDRLGCIRRLSGTRNIQLIGTKEERTAKLATINGIVRTAHE